MHGLIEKTLAVWYSHVDCLRLKKHYISVWLTQWQIRVGTIINKTPNRHCTMYVDAWVCWIRYQIESFYSENQQLDRVKKRFKVQSCAHPLEYLHTFLKEKSTFQRTTMYKLITLIDFIFCAKSFGITRRFLSIFFFIDGFLPIFMRILLA